MCSLLANARSLAPDRTRTLVLPNPLSLTPGGPRTLVHPLARSLATARSHTSTCAYFGLGRPRPQHARLASRLLRARPTASPRMHTPTRAGVCASSRVRARANMRPPRPGLCSRWINPSGGVMIGKPNHNTGSGTGLALEARPPSSLRTPGAGSSTLTSWQTWRYPLRG